MSDLDKIRNLEDKIKNERDAEARKKDFRTMKGKFGFILKYLGEPMIEHLNLENQFNDIMSARSEPFDFYNLDHDETSNEIPTIVSGVFNDDPEGWEWSERTGPVNFVVLNEIGNSFNGLSRGMQLYIKNIDAHIVVEYKGNIVYEEDESGLLAYTPADEWELLVEKLYAQAKQLHKIQQQSDRTQTESQKEKNISSFLGKLKEKWGF